jgi:hypothetical protein
MGGAIGPRTPRATRAKRRTRSPRSPLLALAGRLTDRDRRLCDDLFEHRILTTHQVQDLYFSSAAVTRKRLAALYRYQVVDRYRPPVPRGQGSAPNHYVLDNLGARVVAAERGVDYRQLKFRKENVEELPFRSEIPHLVETNGFFTRLAWACRHGQRASLTEWLSEKRCAIRWGSIVLADGYGKVAGQNGCRSFLLEFDRGTESSPRLALKLARYEQVALLDEGPDLALFCFPDTRREALARRAFYDPGMTVATATWDRYGEDPLGPVWLRFGEERRRLLLDLPISKPGQRSTASGG